MFERIKRSDEASASSAQGKKLKKFKVVFVAVAFKNVAAISRSISSPCSSIAYFDFLNFILKLRWKE